ncbi:hypothetical protein PG993_014516 [Apiospora rasikravindrae]|uniref:Uncharacterized protein n=1 Tax=Apiospora rasikravindrae TaxID=990691 RepID=A0ABR1RND1_9PEZI
MASHKKKDSDKGGQGDYQSIADDDVVGDNGRSTPGPSAQESKKPGVFRRLSRSLRKTFTSDIDEKNDPEILRMKAREKRWKAQAEKELNGPFTGPDINSLEGPGRPFVKSVFPPYHPGLKTWNQAHKNNDTDNNTHNDTHKDKDTFHDTQLAEEELQRVSRLRLNNGERKPRHQQALLQEPKPIRTQSLVQPTSRTRPTRRSNTMKSSLGRSGSLSQRYPGDVSHRPLEQIKKENKVAQRGPHLRKATLPRTDPIDTLDNILGHSYHHEGPFDATLASRNVNKKYAPVEALKTTNMEALKATPNELVQDSLTKHVPLQGTANIPPGMMDISGRRMSYEEGADLQREPFASGGPSRRYEDVVSQQDPFILPTCTNMGQNNVGHISTILEEDEEIDTANITNTAQAQANRSCQDYHPDDLKGKGEPSYTLERAFKHGKSASVDDGPGVYEMQPRGMSRSSPSKDKEGDVLIQQRSRSSSFGEGPSGSGARATSSDSPFGGSSSSSPGKRLSTGLKKRIGSIRRKAGRSS